MPPDQTRLRAALQLVQAGRFPDAEAACKGLVQEEPDNAEARSLLAQLMLRRGATPEAIEHLKEAVNLAPKSAMHRIMLGQALVSLGDWRAGLAALSGAVLIAPGQFEPLAALGFALARSGNREAAHETLGKCIPLLPANADLCRQFAQAARDAGQWEAAGAGFMRVGDLLPKDAASRIAVAESYAARSEPRTALNWARRAVALEPGNASAWSLVATLLERLGEDEGAVAAGRRALELDGAQVGAAIALSHALRRLGRAEEALGVLHKIAGSFVGPPPHPGFAGEMGHVLEAMGDRAGAWKAFEAGRAAWREVAGSRRLSPEAFPRLVDSLLTFVRETDFSGWPRSRGGGARPAPVFVVGFPRSGGALVERMLAGATKALIADEWPLVRTMTDALVAARPGGKGFPGAIGVMDEKLRAALEGAYWKRLESRVGAAALKGVTVVDKLPLNILALPLIRRVFPEAKVIVTLRDPRDVVLSCFTQDFELSEGMSQFLSLEGTARFFVQVMDFWQVCKERLGLAALEVRYEDAMRDGPGSTRALLGFLGLGEQKQTGASIGEKPRPVRTGRVARWKDYHEQLAPVMGLVEASVTRLGYATV
ncbi:MAG: sulfotransferase [Phycisphaerales bacterium]|nr:sulfotransferase [Phycisphaerales bacterium]